MRALVLLCINQHTKFKMPRKKYKNGSHDPDKAPCVGVVCHPQTQPVHKMWPL